MTSARIQKLKVVKVRTGAQQAEKSRKNDENQLEQVYFKRPIDTNIKSLFFNYYANEGRRIKKKKQLIGGMRIGFVNKPQNYRLFVEK